MKKRQLTVEEYNTASGVCTVTISNARYQKNYPYAVEKIIKAFLGDKEVFFGFCRTDGVNLTNEQQEKLKNEIPQFFQKNGDFQKISEYLTVARATLNDCSYSFVPSVFDYYLETVMFSSKAGWEFIKQYYSDYQKHRFEEIILEHFADVLLYYFDSGDFSVCFDSKIYSPKKVREIIDRSFKREK